MSAPTSVLIDRAAEMLAVSRRTIYYRIRQGRLETIRTRCGSQRVLIVSVERLIDEERRRRAAARVRAADDSTAELPMMSSSV